MCQMKDKHIPDSVDVITPYPKKDELQCYYLGPSICLTGEEKPRKNFTQETYPDRGIEPGPTAWQSRKLLPAPQRWT